MFETTTRLSIFLQGPSTLPFPTSFGSKKPRLDMTTRHYDMENGGLEIGRATVSATFTNQNTWPCGQRETNPYDMNHEILVGQ